MTRITDATINEFLDKMSSNSAISVGAGLASELSNAKQLVKTLESRQAINDRKILSALAITVQEQIPVSATFTRNTCHFTYKSRDLTVTLDWASGKWKVEGDHRIHKRFLKQGNSTPITEESLAQLAREIAAYFSMRYKRLAQEYTPGDDDVSLDASPEEAMQDEIVNEL